MNPCGVTKPYIITVHMLYCISNCFSQIHDLWHTHTHCDQQSNEFGWYEVHCDRETESNNKQVCGDYTGQHGKHENVYQNSPQTSGCITKRHSRYSVTIRSTTSPKTGIPSSKWQRIMLVFQYSEPSILTLRTLLTIKKANINMW